MIGSSRIVRVRGRRVWDSRGVPVVEAEVQLEGGAVGRAIAPASGFAVVGEALDLRDGGAAFAGRDVMRALEHVNDEIARAIAGLDAADQGAVDRRLLALDTTPDRRRLGGNAMFATSLAVAHAAAAANDVPVWTIFARGASPGPLPLPRVQIIDCGLTPDRACDFAGISLIAIGADDYASALDWSAEVTRAAAELIDRSGRGQPVAGPRGALRFSGATSNEAIELAVRAIEKAGFAPGEDLALAVDVRAALFGRAGRYRTSAGGAETDTRGMIERYLAWLRRYPIVSLSDPLGADEIAGVAALAASAGTQIEIACGDAIVADPRRVRQLADEKAGNALVLEPGQVATLTELRAAHDEARAVGWRTILSGRTGDTESGWLVHLAVGWGIGQMAAGGLARGERIAKWNEGLRLAETLPSGGTLPPRSDFPW